MAFFLSGQRKNSNGQNQMVASSAMQQRAASFRQNIHLWYGTIDPLQAKTLFTRQS
jgi:hypothetical protein